MTQIFKTLEDFLTVAISATLFLSFLAITGCGSDEDEAVIEPQNALALTVGEMKTPETAPGAPQLAVPAGTPTVTSVGYYSDWQLTKPIKTAVSGDTIYTKVVFSEPMRHIVADDQTARPVLYYRIDGKLTRYRVAAHGASGDNFQSRDAKPKDAGTTTFICKYTVQADALGKFTLSVGKLSTDTEGNTLAAFYTHKEKVQIREPDTTPPEVVEVQWYHDAELTQPITDTVYAGEDIYTKIVFSEAMKVVAGSNNQSRPILYYQIGRERTRYHIITDGALQNNTAKTEDGVTFLCKNTVPDVTNTTLQIMVGKFSVDRAGNTLSMFYRHKERIQIKIQLPTVEDVRSRVEDVDRRPSVRLVYFRPKGYPVKQGVVESLRKLIVEANRYYADEMQRHGFGRKTFAVETDSSGVPVVHSIVGQFEESYYRTDERNIRGVYRAKDEFRERYPDGPQHVYVFAMDMTRDAFITYATEPSCAFGGLHYVKDEENRDALGGYVLLPASGGCSESLPLMMHELGHAFGLHHDFREGVASNLIMAYGRQSRLSKDAAEWLSVSVFFNNIVSHNSRGNITLASDPKHTPQGTQLSFQVEDVDGLHQIQILYRENGSDTVIDFKILKGVTDIIESSSSKFAEYMAIVQIIDKRGGITNRRFPSIN